MPARTNSVFLAGLPSLSARILSASRTSYSGLGMVKLSRTILGFFTLTTLMGIGLVALAGATTGLLGLAAFTGLVAGLATGFLAVTGLAATGAALRTGDLRLTGGLTAALIGAALTAVVDGASVVVAGLGAVAFAVDVMGFS